VTNFAPHVHSFNPFHSFPFPHRAIRFEEFFLFPPIFGQPGVSGTLLPGFEGSPSVRILQGFFFDTSPSYAVLSPRFFELPADWHSFYPPSSFLSCPPICPPPRLPRAVALTLFFRPGPRCFRVVKFFPTVYLAPTFSQKLVSGLLFTGQASCCLGRD